jgi:predicted nucleotide-binding protein
MAKNVLTRKKRRDESVAPVGELANNLFRLAHQLEAFAKEGQSKKISEPLRKLRDAANDIGRSWSKSWLGYQSRVYYENFEPVPAGAHFSSEWGFQDLSLGLDVGGSRGRWYELTFESVREAIFARSGIDSLVHVEQFATRCKETFDRCREEFISIVTVNLENKSDPFLARLKDQMEKLRIGSKLDYARALQPRGQFFSRDSLALSQGFQIPPHIAVLGEVTALLEASRQCGEMAKIVSRAADHLQVRGKYRRERQPVGTNVFVGHGRSPVWKDLKDFLQDRLDLPWDEFNRIPVAGITNIERLSEMLNHAAIAFLVMTAEDEQIDGTIRARENVIHEAGLFQGRLGFTKAIVLLEEGCQEFSNIHGLGQIRFPQNNIKAAFEEVRLVLEREGIIESEG